MLSTSYSTQQVEWSKARDILACIREQVFVREQNVPMEMELDEHDEHCYHLLAYDQQGNGIGTARLLKNGQIGRMAVLADYRGKGIGSKLLKHIVELAKSRGLTSVYLHAQTHAIGFYEKHHFRIEGNAFTEAGIPHVQMLRRL